MEVSIKAVRRGKRSVDLMNKVRAQGRQIVIKHVLGMAYSLYQVYPVGPPHTDGTPHTRDTFEVVLNNQVIASKGSFWNTTALGVKTEGDVFVVAFRAAGASFFVEWGTIYMEARPIIRTGVRVAKMSITNELRTINVSTTML